MLLDNIKMLLLNNLYDYINYDVYNVLILGRINDVMIVVGWNVSIMWY